jgi:hypothetical protein
MNSSERAPIPATLAQGWRLFTAGLVPAFPWVLTAELLALLRPAGISNNLLNADLSQLFKPAHLGLALFFGCLQALLYTFAIIQLSSLTNANNVKLVPATIRSVVGLLLGYLIYEALVVIGLGIALVFFLSAALMIGVTAGVLITIIPLAPTAYVSTALALFAYPVVLEKKGPLAALSRSMQLTRSNWGRAALIISIPALVLLAVSAAEELPFFEALKTALQHVTSVSSGLDAAQLQNLFASQKFMQAATWPLGWRILFSVLRAFGWWYALALCYAEYRELSSRRDH